MGRAGLLLVVFTLVGCGGDGGSAVEQEDFIVELEVPLVPDLEEPDVYGRLGMSPNGRNGTKLVLRLDKPFKSPLEAFIRRGGCGGFRVATTRPDFELGQVENGRLDTEVDAPTRDLRESGYAIIVREPIPQEKLDEAARERRGANLFEKGVCGDLSSADRVDEF